MATVPAPVAEPQVGAPPPRPLRIWPAVGLLFLAWVAKSAPLWMPAGGMGGFILMFMGPAAAAVGIGFWWLLASRATLRERFVVLGGVVAALILANLAAHPSVGGMGLLIFGIPWTITALVAVWVVVKKSAPSKRTASALLAAALVAAYVVSVRTEGVRGNMAADVHFRWTPTAEERFLASRGAGTKASSAVDPASPDNASDWDGGDGSPWPEFRGPGRMAHAVGVRLATDWTSHPPRPLWRHAIGPGWSSFCVVAGRLFTQEQRGETEAVVCYAAESGEEIWTHGDTERFWETVGGAGPRATPTFHDGRLFTVGAAGIVNCLDARTGQRLWKRDLRDDTGAKPPMWGFSSSPLVHAGMVVIYAGGAGQTPNPETGQVPHGVIAYDAQSGEVRWKGPAGDHGYSTPQLDVAGESPRVLVLSNSGLTAFELETGKVVWEHAWKTDVYRVVQPLQIDRETFLLGTGNGIGTRRIRVAPSDTGFALDEQWTSRDMKPYFNDFVAHQGFLYGFDHDIFACVDLNDGRRVWKKGRYGSGQVMLLPSAGQLLVLSEKGELVLLAANPQRHDELARFPALEGKTWNHPVLVGSRLYVRNGEEAACYEMSLDGG